MTLSHLFSICQAYAAIPINLSAVAQAAPADRRDGAPALARFLQYVLDETSPTHDLPLRAEVDILLDELDVDPTDDEVR